MVDFVTGSTDHNHLQVSDAAELSSVLKSWDKFLGKQQRTRPVYLTASASMSQA